MAAAPAGRPGVTAKAAGLTELQRIQSIEEYVIGCIELAAAATEQLSSIGNVDKAAVVSACEAYIDNIKKCQALVQEVLSHPTTVKTCDANSYYAQSRAQIAAEKVRAVQGHLADMIKVVESGNARTSAPHPAGPPAAAEAAGGAAATDMDTDAVPGAAAADAQAAGAAAAQP